MVLRFLFSPKIKTRPATDEEEYVRPRGICHLDDSTRLIYRESSAIGNKTSTCCVRQGRPNCAGVNVENMKNRGSRLSRRRIGKGSCHGAISAEILMNWPIDASTAPCARADTSYFVKDEPWGHLFPSIRRLPFRSRYSGSRALSRDHGRPCVTTRCSFIAASHD